MSILLFFMSLVGGILLGLSSAPSALAILLCAGWVLLDLLRRGKINPAAAWAVLFIAYNAFSGIVFNGFASMNETNIVGWLGNEGRIFLYYWPAILILQALNPRPNPTRIEAALRRIIRSLTVVVFLIMLAKTVSGFTTFSTHHAAGTFIAAFVFYHLFRLDLSRSMVDLVYLLMSLVAMLASNSRTSLLTVVIAVIIVYLSAAQVQRVARILILMIPLAVAMPLFFPTQFARLADAADVETYISMRDNLLQAYSADSPIEVGKAFDLSGSIDISGNANLVIRSYLWGRSLGEGFRSPIFGEGFGRVNDLGREYVGIPYLVYPVVKAAYANPSNLTAHNGYLQVFAELGIIGSALLFMLYRSIWVGLNGNRLWSLVGRACLVSLLLMSITQHAFGAPIYGLSLFLLAALSNRMCLSGRTRR